MSSFIKKRVNTLMVILLMLGICVPSSLSAQDTVSVLGPSEFLSIVRDHHPVSAQADIRLRRGSASVLMAQGGFEPKLYSDVARKYFKEQEYYQLIDAGVKIPTWFGLELKAGYEQNQGDFLNPQNNTSGGGLWYAGVTLPIGQGLFIDERRAELRNAEIYRNITETERQIILNDLLLEAAEVYWSWYMAYYSKSVYEEALRLAEIRFDAVRSGARLGDLPSIDTLEAGIQVRNRKLSLQQANLDLANSRALLSVYLWAEGIVPLEIGESTVPPTEDYIIPVTADSSLKENVYEFIDVHPDIVKAGLKVDQLEIDRRWKLEQFKPTIDLSFNPLVQADGLEPVDGFSPENYKLGVNFSMPIFFRKERGGLQLAKIKIREQELTLAEKRQMVYFKIRSAINDLEISFEQLAEYGRVVDDYRDLLAGERKKFDAGESSLFLVNSRESSYINARVKLIDLTTKNQKARVKSIYSTGRLADNFMEISY